MTTRTREEYDLAADSHDGGQRRRLSSLRCVAIATACLTALLVALALCGCGGQADDSESSAATTTTAEAVKANDDPRGSTTIEELQLDESLLEGDLAVLATTFFEDRITRWYNSGATKANAEGAVELGDVEMEAMMVAAEGTAMFREALLPVDWESNPRLVEYVDALSDIHRRTLTLNFMTSFPEDRPEDVEPYRRIAVVDEVVSSSRKADGTVEITCRLHDEDNHEKNSVPEVLKEGGTEGAYLGTVVCTFAAIDGKVVLTDIRAL